MEESGIDTRTPSAEDDEWISSLGLQSIADQEALLGGQADPWVWIQTEEGSRFGASTGDCLAQARTAAYGTLQTWLTVTYLPQVAAVHEGGMAGWARTNPADAQTLQDAIASLERGSA